MIYTRALSVRYEYNGVADAHIYSLLVGRAVVAVHYSEVELEEREALRELLKAVAA